MTITEFLLARIEEDEAVANEASDRYDTGMSLWVVDDDYRHDIVGATAKRVLAECEAKRQVMALNDSLLRGELEKGDASALGAGLMLRDVLGALASVYADHPDYDSAWAV